MKCPICGNTLVPGKKDPSCLLCHNCRKKFRVRAKKGKTSENPQAALKETEAEMKRKKKAARAAQAAEKADSDDDDDVEFHLRYANIPPKAVREKQEREMRKAYDELLSIGEEEREQKKHHGFFHRRKK